MQHGSGIDDECHIAFLSDGRTLSYAEFCSKTGYPVLWNHGGPGNRMEPTMCMGALDSEGFRFICPDRPGYGKSAPKPSRSIGDWSADVTELLDSLDVKDYVAVGVSTGGAYALALGATTKKVTAAIACCSVTDTRWAEGRSMMPDAAKFWNMPDRETALKLAEAQFGSHGEKLKDLVDYSKLPQADQEFMSTLRWQEGFTKFNQISFSQGVAGYVDDRIADGQGWASFNIEDISCPVTLLHGDADVIVPVAHSTHTSGLIPNAELIVCPHHGHFSITGFIMSALKKCVPGAPASHE